MSSEGKMWLGPCPAPPTKSRFLLALLWRDSYAQQLSVFCRLVIHRDQHAHLHLSLHLRVLIDHKLHAPTGVRFQGEGVALISNIRHFSADRFCRLLLSLLTWLAGLLTWLAGLARRCLGLLP